MSNHSAAPENGLTAPVRVTDLIAASPAPTAMPGWHIFADFTPPELAVERRTRVVRLAAILSLVLVAALAFVGFDMARGEAVAADEAVLSEQAIGQSLRSQQQQFASVTVLQAAITQARTDLAALMHSDVDVDALVDQIWQALPEGMTIGQFSVIVPPLTGGAAADASKGGGAAALDTSDAVHIGTVTVAGTGTAIDDVPAFIDALGRIKGVYSPFPTSNAIDPATGTTTYGLQFTLTDVLLSGRFDTEGGN